MKGEVETQFLLSGLLLHTQPLHSSEQHTRAHLEFSSHFGYHRKTGYENCLKFTSVYKYKKE